jgi:flavin reductase (DIM6/NTAB) family NADH-FMN oxidoreductase RutF
MRVSLDSPARWTQHNRNHHEEFGRVRPEEAAMIDEQQFRALMSGVCAPVAVVTTVTDATAHGATVSSLASLSLTPPLVSVAFARGSMLLARIQRARRFGINVLGHAQADLATVFARRSADRPSADRPSADRFAGTDWFLDEGLPRLADAPSWMVCDLYQTIEAGDHLLLFGLVRCASTRPDIAPLVYAHRTFGTHSRFAERPRPAIADLISACAS